MNRNRCLAQIGIPSTQREIETGACRASDHTQYANVPCAVSRLCVRCARWVSRVVTGVQVEGGRARGRGPAFKAPEYSCCPSAGHPMVPLTPTGTETRTGRTSTAREGAAIAGTRPDRHAPATALAARGSLWPRMASSRLALRKGTAGQRPVCKAYARASPSALAATFTLATFTFATLAFALPALAAALAALATAFAAAFA